MGTKLVGRDLLAMYVMMPEQFRDEELREATFRSNGQTAIPWSGGRAAVFQAQLPDGRKLAVRVSMVTSGDDLRVPYLALERWAQANALPELARTQWVDHGLVVDGIDVPLLKMDWIDGLTLDEHVDDCVQGGRSDDLQLLADNWLSSVNAMGAVRFAHGDFHAQNVLIANNGETSSLRFVDYDSVWLPDLMKAPAEVGHRAFQHPNRTWGEHMDAFGAAVVYLSLRAVVAVPTLWARFHRGDMTLLLDEHDLADSTRDVWSAIDEHPDKDVCRMAAALREWCREPAQKHPSLQAFIDSVRGRPINDWPPTTAQPAKQQAWGGPQGSTSASPDNPAVLPGPNEPSPASSPPSLQTWPLKQPGAAPKTLSGGPTSPPAVPEKRSVTTADWFVIAIIVAVILIAMGR